MWQRGAKEEQIREEHSGFIKISWNATHGAYYTDWTGIVDVVERRNL